jgi:anhydro-N-acetylmuramic acid kinase
MNKGIRKLSTIAGHQGRIILGVMSGTSMDGIDLALCRVRGASMSTGVDVLKFATVPVGGNLKETFDDLAYNPETGAGRILRFESQLTEAWCRGIAGQIDEWDLTISEIDLLASHGQTILHHPDADGGYHGTLQIVDGDALAQSLGIITVSDFRRKHIAAGYEGAPLAPLGEVLLFSDPDATRVLLNLGGIANFTILESGLDEPVVPFATDTGPANTLLDAAIKRLMPGKSYDKDGMIARSGEVDRNLLEELMKHPFFERGYPKSTGQEEFNWEWVHECMLKSGPDLVMNNLLATLTELTAQTVNSAIRENLDSDEAEIFVSGGGWNNSFLIDRLKAYLPESDIVSSAGLGLDPEAKEAALFAVLANELIAGEGWINESGKRFRLGKISLP